MLFHQLLLPEGILLGLAMTFASNWILERG